jgi:ATP-dependent Clp protease protease subunit
LSDATGQPIEKIQQDTERDNYLRAIEAMEYGLVDRVITSRNDQTNEE